MDSINSYPGAARFRYYSVVIFVLTAIPLFFVIIDGLEKDVEEASVNNTINEINAALAISMYQYILKGQIRKMSDFDGENPFTLLAIHKMRVQNYKGAIRSNSENLQHRSWYFNSDSRQVVYHSKSFPMKLKLVFEYVDKDKNESFDPDIDAMGGLFLK